MLRDPLFCRPLVGSEWAAMLLGHLWQRSGIGVLLRHHWLHDSGAEDGERTGADEVSVQ